MSYRRCVLPSSRCFWLCPGYRHRDTGVLTSVGNNGYSWSSTVSSTNGMNLNFNYAGLNPSNANNRAYGFQVRCLQAFTRMAARF